MMISDYIEQAVREARGKGCTCVPLDIDWKRQPNGDLRCVVTHSVACMRFRSN